MHDLFTRGVDENGQLRPPFEEAPHLYYETELGWIPKEWGVEPLGDLIGQIDSGWSPVCDSEVARLGEWGVLKTTAVVWKGFMPIENKKLPQNEIPIESIQARCGDVLITRKGPVDRVGVAVFVANTPDYLMFPDTVFRTRVVAKEKIKPEFLVKVIEDDVVQIYWNQRKIGLAEAQVNLNHGILRSTPIKYPSKVEQSCILKILSSVSRKIEALNFELCKQTDIKTALMQDLLTGKVRVAEDTEDRKEVIT